MTSTIERERNQLRVKIIREIIRTEMCPIDVRKFLSTDYQYQKYFQLMM